MNSEHCHRIRTGRFFHVAQNRRELEILDGGAAVCRECAGGRIHDTHSLTPHSYCLLKIISGLI